MVFAPGGNPGTRHRPAISDGRGEGRLLTGFSPTTRTAGNSGTKWPAAADCRHRLEPLGKVAVKLRSLVVTPAPS